MTLYDRLAATDDGARALAVARLRRETMRALLQAQAASGLSPDQVAAKLGRRARTVRKAFDSNGELGVGAVAEYLHALGYELELNLVPAGEPRRKLVAGRGPEVGCGQRKPEPIPFVVPAGWTDMPLASFDPAIPAQVRIDLNARAGATLVAAHIDRADRPVCLGETVTVYEPDDGVQAPAVVERIAGRWLHLRVDWDAMQDSAGVMDPADDRIAAAELARGEGRRFTTAADAAAWLQDRDG